MLKVLHLKEELIMSSDSPLTTHTDEDFKHFSRAYYTSLKTKCLRKLAVQLASDGKDIPSDLILEINKRNKEKV